MPADNYEYVFRVSNVVRQQLLELPPDERREVIDCLRHELTGSYGDQTTELAAWHLPEEDAPRWVTILSCVVLAAYRSMNKTEIAAWLAHHGKGALPAPGYMVLYLQVDVDPTGAQ